MAAAAAIEGIRELDRDGSIGLIGAEPHAPYNRPPLTKGLWKGDSLESIWRNFERSGLTMYLGRTATLIERNDRRVTDDEGTTYAYGKLLLATGLTPRKLPFGDGEIIHFRSLNDYTRLRSLTETGDRFAVIGGGFIGSEIAAGLAMNGKEAVFTFPDGAICSRLF